jgi:glycerol uptake facilitator-like aquaporin
MKANSRNAPSFTKRLVFAFLFALIATGTTFYVVTFAAMFAALWSGNLNPAVTPGVTWSLRDLGVPLSLAVGVIVFAATLWRSRRPLHGEPGFQVRNRKPKIRN